MFSKCLIEASLVRDAGVTSNHVYILGKLRVAAFPFVLLLVFHVAVIEITG